MTAWRSQSVAELLRLMNQPSDNFMAEMLVKVLGARFGGAGSTAAGTRVMPRTSSPSSASRRTLVDGSGLSRSDRTSPRDVVDLLTELDGDAAFTGSLAVAGRSGTLATPHARHRRAGPLPREDRHAARRVRARRLLHADGGRAGRVRLPHELRQPVRARGILQDRMAIALARYRP